MRPCIRHPWLGALVASTVFVSVPHAVWAQRFPVQPIELLGKDVRVVAERSDTGEIRGKVIAADGQLLTIQPAGADTLRIPLETIQRLRVRAGAKTQITDGAIGALLGALGGAVVERYYVQHYGGGEDADAYAIVVGMPVGALIGGVAGLAIGYGHFEDVPLR